MSGVDWLAFIATWVLAGLLGDWLFNRRCDTLYGHPEMRCRRWTAGPICLVATLIMLWRLRRPE